ESPEYIVNMCHDADIIITGRMHLSILGLITHTPTLILATQGKVTGLAESIGHPTWAIEPVPGWACTAVQQIDAIRASADTIHRELASHIDNLSKLSQLNFDGLA